MWVKKRHAYSFFILKRVFRVLCKIKYNYKPIRCKEKGPFLIIGNHSIAHDPFLYVNMFKGRMYFLTTDELYRMGFFSKLVKIFLAPIPKTKSLSDTSAIKRCFEVAKYKKNICIFPEGATTYSGDRCNIDPSITKLAKKLKYKVAIVNVYGGYQSYPKFATKTRKGKIYSHIKKIITPEELEKLSNEELYSIICEDLKVPLLEHQKFKGKCRAECLETTLYYCPNCDSFDTTKSKVHDFFCTKCGINYHVDEYLNLINENGKTSISALYKKQEEKINSYNLETLNQLEFEDEAVLYEVVNYVKLTRAKGTVRLKNRAIIIGEYEFKLDDIIASCTTGSAMVDIYYKDKTYQIKGCKNFSALKYMNVIYRNINLINDKEENKFLGV